MPGRAGLKVSSPSWLCGAILAGLILGLGGYILTATGLMTLTGLAILGWLRRHRRVSLVCLALAAGLWRGEQHLVQSGLLLTQIGSKVTLTGTITSDPTVNSQGRYVFEVSDLIVSGRPELGTVRASTFPLRLQRGWRVALSGKLRPGFATWQAELSYPQYQVLARRQSLLQQTRQQFAAGLRASLPVPVDIFALGLLLGARGLIPPQMQLELSRTGLSHLIVVSGYNLTIIVHGVRRILRRLGRNIATVLSLWLIGAFVILCGASPAIVRAAVVSVVILLSTGYGLRVASLDLLLVSAAGTALWNPANLTDLGWQMSFAAYFGILILAPAVREKLGAVSEKLALRLLIESSAAQLLTLPLILGSFGQLSLVSPLANMIILPLMPAAMLLSLWAGVVGMWLPLSLQWLAAPTIWLLDFILKLTAAFSALPWASRDVSFTTTDILIGYGLILLLTVVLQRPKRLGV